MNIIDAFIAEHGVFKAQLDQLEQSVNKLLPTKELKAQYAMIAAGLMGHAALEDRLLYGPFSTKIRTETVHNEHLMIERLAKQVAEQENPTELQHLLLLAVQVERRHFENEEKAIFPGARSVLSQSEMTELGSEYAGQRKVKA
jgi:hemerythrin-like domain-containing protein